MLSEDTRLTILYIEDDPASKAMLGMLFDPYPGITFLTAWTAEEGIHIATEHKPELIFIDINLPCMDGKWAITKLKENPVLKNTRMVALSADALKSQIDKAMTYGFDQYLTKPAEVEDLFSIIESIIEQRNH